VGATGGIPTWAEEVDAAASTRAVVPINPILRITCRTAIPLNSILVAKIYESSVPDPTCIGDESVLTLSSVYPSA
jgi:hypothetical protein